MTHKKKTWKWKSKVWLYPGHAGWHFVTVPKKESGEIRTLFGSMAKGWGSLPVSVTLGKTVWETSIFPDNTSKTYLLPLKAAMRKKEGVLAEDTVSLSITIQV